MLPKQVGIIYWKDTQWRTVVTEHVTEHCVRGDGTRNWKPLYMADRLSQVTATLDNVVQGEAF